MANKEAVSINSNKKRSRYILNVNNKIIVMLFYSGDCFYNSFLIILFNFLPVPVGMSFRRVNYALIGRNQ